MAKRRADKTVRRLPHDHSLIRRPLPSSLRQDVYSATGIKPTELDCIEKSNLSCSLSDINDRDLTSGPFCLEITDDPRRHLRFDDTSTNASPTIKVLDTQTVCILSLLDLTGIMEYYNQP